MNDPKKYERHLEKELDATREENERLKTKVEAMLHLVVENQALRSRLERSDRLLAVAKEALEQISNREFPGDWDTLECWQATKELARAAIRLCQRGKRSYEVNTAECASRASNDGEGEG